MLWLGVHFPLLPLEICGSTANEENCRSGLQAATAGKNRESGLQTATAHPQAITENNRIMLCNSAARAAGIAIGSTLATAHSIAPQLVHHRRNPVREHQRLELLAEALYGFSARVSLVPPAAAAAVCGEPMPGIVLEIGGSLRLFGDAGELTRQVETLCRNMGHAVRVRQAKTPLAALILARADSARIAEVPLPLAAVEPERLSAQRLERLANMGVHNLQQLLALPASGLARRFGADLVDYLARITGDQPDPRPAIEPAQRFRATLHLLDPLNDKQALVFPMQRLLSDLQHWLVARQLGSGQLRWHFASSGSREPRRVCMPVRFARMRQSREAFLDITRLALAETDLPADVVDIVLEARRLEPWSPGSGGLFRHLPGAPSAEPDEMSTLVDQLRARLGSRACYTLESTDQHTPEQAWRAAAPLQRGARVSSEDGQPLRRPLWLFDPPRAIRREQLTVLRGPERIHTGWWVSPSGEGSHSEDGAGSHSEDSSSQGEARDYYVARHRNGAECWVFVDPQGHWRLHGYFS